MAVDSIISVFGTGTEAVTTNDVAAIDIPEDGLIIGILGRVLGDVMASEDEAHAELSFLSTNQIDVNDARASIMQVMVKTGTVTTSGQGKASETVWLGIPEGIPVAAGERIHMHTHATTGVTPTGLFMLYLTFTPGTGRRSQRRR